MKKIQLPTNIRGTSGKYPYLAKFKDKYTSFASVIILVEGENRTIVMGEYVGHDPYLLREYRNGAVLAPSVDTYLRPFNRESKG